MAKDVYYHLHDEAYDIPFQRPLFLAQDAIYVRSRESFSLNGHWNFTLDLHDEGLRQKWFEYKPCAPSLWPTPRDYDPFMGEQISVPSCFNLQKPEWLYFEGSAWYTKIVPLKDIAKNAHYILRIGACANEAFIFINGQNMGFHQGASTPFYCCLDQFMDAQELCIQIVARNIRRLQDVPMCHIDWFNYGGIHRDVDIFSLPQNYIKDYFLYLEKDGKTAKLEVTLAYEDEGNICFSIPELGLEKNIAVMGRKAELTFTLKDHILWSPAHPKLYDISISFKQDEIADSFGFRHIQTKGNDVYLNNEKIFLKGIAVHEDDIALGRCTSKADILRRIAHAKELGCNFLRLAHYPHHEWVAEICDEQGLLLWEEIPVYWAIDFKNAQSLSNAKNQLRELIYRDRNRCSVIMWSVGNENADTDMRLSFMSQLVDTARELDPSRLITAACLINFQNLRIEDRLTEYLDVIGINEYYGWYIPFYEDLIQISKNSKPCRPVIISETGAGAAIGKDAPSSGWFSEEKMQNIYEKQCEILPQIPALCGFVPWLLYDFRSPRRNNIFQQGFNRKGLIAQDKQTKKAGFDVLSGFFHSKI